MEKTREIPKGWHFLNENELIRGTFRHSFSTDTNCIIYLDYDPKKDRDTHVELFKTNTPKLGAFYVINNKIYICITTGGDPTGKMLYMFSNPNSSNDDHIIDNLSEITLWEVRNKQPEQEHSKGYEFGTKTIESVSTEIDKAQIKLDMLKKEPEGLKPKLYDLPEWLRVFHVFDRIFTYTNERCFTIENNDWFKVVNPSKIYTNAKLQECKYSELVVGDWFTTSSNKESNKEVFGVIDTELTSRVSVLWVDYYGNCCDKTIILDDCFIDGNIVYKIVKA